MEWSLRIYIVKLHTINLGYKYMKDCELLNWIDKKKCIETALVSKAYFHAQDLNERIY